MVSIPLLAQIPQRPIVLTSTRKSSRDSVIFSQDIFRKIFAFLPTSSLVASSCVHRSWRVWVKETIWPMKSYQDMRDDFTPLFNERVLSWEEALLSRFIDDVMSREKSCDSAVREKNPELGIQSPYLYMPSPCVQHEIYEFSIRNLIDIEMNEKGKPHSILIRGEEGKNISHLAVKDHFLFVLRADGVIIQINYITQEETQRIKTVYYKENEEYRRSTKGFSGIERAFCKEFYIKEGCIIIVYLWATHPTRRLEIIPYGDESSGKAQLIEDLSFNSEKLFLENHQMMMMGKNSIMVRNLSTSETSMFPVEVSNEGHLLDISLAQHVLYALDSNKHIHRINLKTKKVRSKSHSLTQPIQQCVVIRDLVFGLSLSRRRIHVVDIHSKKALEVGVLPLNIRDPECRCVLLKRLIGIATMVFQERTIQSESHSKCVIS